MLSWFPWMVLGGITIQKTQTPVLDSIAEFGVKAESLQPSFPTKTFPNHYTIVTGLYPDNHGIVNNTFILQIMKKFIVLEIGKLLRMEVIMLVTPIWNLAESQGVKAASYFWVGSEANIQQKHPSIWKSYQHNFPFEQRVDSIISWLKLPEDIRPRLLLLYFHQPDSKGHKYGPEQ
jgi:predicted AlkP superfamily pyrophosphatase or phosphodiesterase